MRLLRTNDPPLVSTVLRLLHVVAVRAPSARAAFTRANLPASLTALTALATSTVPTATGAAAALPALVEAVFGALHTPADGAAAAPGVVVEEAEDGTEGSSASDEEDM